MKYGRHLFDKTFYRGISFVTFLLLYKYYVMNMNFQCGIETPKDVGIIYARKNPQKIFNIVSLLQKKKNIIIS